MASSGFLSYLGLGKNNEAAKKKDTIRALPAKWYTSPEFYELERRSIFSRWWLFITHRSRLQKPGDFLRYNIAGFDFIIIVDRTNTINAFHNICRHRAYTVVEEDKGTKSILSCRYHGWSYGLNGKLAKAPDYQKLDSFDKSQNGLFPIHTHIDDKGFIWVNFDANEKPEVSWEQFFATVDQQERFSKFNFDDYELDHVYEIKGENNWKILADNFNECYHCKTTHPDVPTFLTIDSHDVEVKDGHMQHDQAPTEEQKSQGYDVNSTYYFPATSMSVSPHFMMIQKFMPSGATDSRMHYEVFRNKNSSDKDFHAIADTYARVMSEDKVLCDAAQKNLNAGVFTNGELHPRWEKGPLFFQQTVREVVTEHFHREKAAGHEISPATPKLPTGEETTAEELEMCSSIACSSQKEVLAW